MIQQYINYLRNIKGYAENTATAYEKDLRAFAEWAKGHLKDARWSMISRDDLDMYVTELATMGLKPATTNRKLSAIAGLYRYMNRQGLRVENPSHYESRRKVAETIPNTIPVHELHIAWQNAMGVTKVMIGLLATTGIRIQELLDLEWEDIDYANCAMTINGKGSRQRIVYTTPEHLETLKAVNAMHTMSGRIFTISQRQARHMIWNALRPYTRAKQLSPHAIRHTFATHAANMGANVSTIGAALGHKHIETTQKYLDMTSAPVRMVCQQYNMFNN